MGGTEKKLDCCVVRDLLPSYIEELTEPAQELVKLQGVERRSAP